MNPMNEIHMIACFKKGEKTSITRDFGSKEFDCECSDKMCAMTLVSMDLVNRLQTIRDQIGPLKINSGYRCGIHNESVGGRPYSYHLLGMAADVRPMVAPLQALIECAERVFDLGAIGQYSDRLHLDVRPARARWTELHKQ